MENALNERLDGSRLQTTISKTTWMRHLRPSNEPLKKLADNALNLKIMKRSYRGLPKGARPKSW
eukprot:2888896-Prorocentrum_lima.AAC.1